MPRFKRTDNNQKKIVATLRQIPQLSVMSIAHVGGGIGDIIVGYRGKNYLFEIKNKADYKHKQFTEAEKEFMKNWKGQHCVIYNSDDALEILGLA